MQISRNCVVQPLKTLYSQQNSQQKSVCLLNNISCETHQVEWFVRSENYIYVIKKRCVNFSGLFFVLPKIDQYSKVDLRTVSFDVPPQEVNLHFHLH